jgi:hypothetical protein
VTAPNKQLYFVRQKANKYSIEDSATATEDDSNHPRLFSNKSTGNSYLGETFLEDGGAWSWRGSFEKHRLNDFVE